MDTLDSPRGLVPLSTRELASLRLPGDRLGIAALVIAVLALLMFFPPVGLLGLGAMVATASLGLYTIIGQAALLGNAVPIGSAMGAAWEQEAWAVIEATGRETGSVRVMVINEPRPNAFASWTTAGRAPEAAWAKRRP
jgi:hypothetical protein